MIDLMKYLLAQGLTLDQAEEVVEKKTKNPSLTGISIGGKWVILTSKDASKANQMIEAGVPPGTSGTDRAFLEGTENNRQFQDQPEIGDRYKREARKHGKKMGRGEVYKASLARFPGDPRAFVSDIGQAKKVIAQRADEAKRNEDTPAPYVDVAPKIVARETAIELAGQTVTGREVRDTMERVKNRLRPSWKKPKG